MNGYDWIAMPLIPYLYAVDDVSECRCRWTGDGGAAADDYRRST